MQLGAFSVSLAVKDIKTSMAFYAKLGFTQMGGDLEQNWLIMKNGDSVIGLFQGMFEENILTFNPGWDQQAQELESFTDIREIRKALLESGVAVEGDIEEGSKGPASIFLKDPDGNAILVDQHR